MKNGVPSFAHNQGQLVEKLVNLLKQDPSDQKAAEYLLGLVTDGSVVPSVAEAAYRDAVRKVYFAE